MVGHRRRKIYYNILLDQSIFLTIQNIHKIKTGTTASLGGAAWPILFLSAEEQLACICNQT